MSTPEVAAAVAAAHRDHWAMVLAATAATSRDLDLAEDAAQEAFAQSLTAWAETGVPDNPGGWLTTTARRRALDAMRRRRTLERKLPLLVWDDDADVGAPEADERVADEAAPVVLDEQLRLIFLTAHPALAPTSRIALTLRLVGGLSTVQIADAFLVPEPTMAARPTRAKKRIRLSRIPCRVPGAGELEERLVDVLDVVSVLLATPSADVLEAATGMLEVLVRMLPVRTEPRGLLAHALLLRARAGTRTDERGRPVALADQDRERWDRELVDRADDLVTGALADGGRGPYLIQGAIAAAVAVPRRHGDIDWGEVVELYDLLLAHWPTAIVRLGRTVAVAEVEGAGAALALLTPLADELEDHRPFHVIRGELLTRCGEHAAAAEAFRTALDRRGDPGEEELLEEMLQRAT
ncbi:RNA polymerase sigma factor [Brachybacterium sacelli]|uniref:RNA polymerase sigma-70 factor (ECF subfamily) n=1 Tax=Brachybacterium sacelli TaxID=173364 RepID=A0ABS4X6H2_9MICO|nr:RNA polymerase sigma-70 factor (ECF subfamily) [Brachybacterium sacelli]